MQEQHVDVIEWLKRESKPFTSSVPDDDDMTDLHPFGEIVDEARVVVCGEATHGTHEFFALKHRLLKFLVEQKGFTLFAIEDGLIEVDGINQYVLTGNGDIIQLLTDLRFGIWKTQEMVDLIRWMRAYNQRRGERPALQFLGLDMQSCDLVIMHVLTYIDEVDPPAGDEFRELYGGFWSFTEHLSSYSDESPQFKSTCWSQLKHAQELLLARRISYEEKSSLVAFAYTLHCANIVLQAEQMFSLFHYELRSQFMAENAVWHLDQAGPEAKMFIWTHNGHAQAPLDESLYPSLGSCLHQKYNREFRTFGMLVGQGTFNAQDRYKQGEVVEHTLGRPLRTSYECIFQSLDLSRALIDLQDLPDELFEWLEEPRMCRSVGIMYAEKDEENYWSKVSLPQSFDGVFYMQNSTPSQILDLDRSAPVDQRSAPLLISTQPRNMQFEAGLSYWQYTTPPGYTCDFESGLAHSGDICAYLKSKTSDSTQFSSLHQVIKPDAYLQRRIRLSAYVKVLDVKKSAGLWMRIDGPNDYLRLDDMHKRPITGTSSWIRYAIVLDVPKNSSQITFGLHFSGQGKVWIDDIQLEIVEDTVPLTNHDRR